MRAPAIVLSWGGGVALSDVGRSARVPRVLTTERTAVPGPGARPRPPAWSSRRIREAYLSTKCPEAGQEARFPCSHVDPCRSRRVAEPAPQGSGEAVGLIQPIRDRRTFAAVRAEGIRVRQGGLSVVHLDDGGPTRVAYAITRRTGTAVVRNRVRRRLRHLLAEEASVGRVPPGALVITVGPAATTRGTEELRNDVVRLLDALEARRHRTVEAR